jgi:hypothetical protein
MTGPSGGNDVSTEIAKPGVRERLMDRAVGSLLVGGMLGEGGRVRISTFYTEGELILTDGADGSEEKWPILSRIVAGPQDHWRRVRDRLDPET